MILTNCRRTAGGVAAVLPGCRCSAALTDVEVVFEPRFRGRVCDLLATARLPGRLLPMVSLRPEAAYEILVLFKGIFTYSLN